MKILLVGGGSGGPVSPLLAVAAEIKKHHPKAQFLFVGGKKGPERLMASQAGIKFVPISGGKLRRYFSWRNFTTGFETVFGFFQSFKILRDFRPDCIFGTGSFIQVPLVWAAWFLKIPVVLHQQDIEPSLANRLCQLAAKKITVTFEMSQSDFISGMGFFYKKSQGKTVWTGNPFREELRHGNKDRAVKFFNLRGDMPTLLVLGGGTGAEFVNNLISKSLPQLAKTTQIIHSTGAGKFKAEPQENYHPHEFISNMDDAYAAADIVLARAGLSTLTELSNLKKLAIIVPMPDTHQEFNAAYLLKQRAAVVLNQKRLTPESFFGVIRKFLFEHEMQEFLKENIYKIMPHQAGVKIADIIIKEAAHSNG